MRRVVEADNIQLAHGDSAAATMAACLWKPVAGEAGRSGVLIWRVIVAEGDRLALLHVIDPLDNIERSNVCGTAGVCVAVSGADARYLSCVEEEDL